MKDIAVVAYKVFIDTFITKHANSHWKTETLCRGIGASLS